MIFISTESSAKLFNIFWEEKLRHTRHHKFAFYQTFTHAKTNFCTKLKAKKVLLKQCKFWKWRITYNWKNEGFKFVKLQWKHVMTFPFAAKSYTKSQFNEVKRTFNCQFLLSKPRSDCPFLNDLFWKSQSNENEKNFQL